MTTYPLRKLLIDIAARDVGQVETSPNHGPAIAKFWSATTYPDGYNNREPYCSAAACYWVREWLMLPEVAAAFGKSPKELDAWRCKSATAFGWIDWAKSKGLLILDDRPGNVLHTGDIVVFDFSHVGIVEDDYDNRIKTIEANTGAKNQSDGEGIERKDRPREIARAFIRLLV